MDPVCVTSHLFPQGRPRMLYLSQLYAGWTCNILLPTTFRRVHPEWLTSHCFTQSGPRMAYFLSLCTGWDQNVLLFASLNRVDPHCFLSSLFCAELTFNISLPSTFRGVDPEWFTSHCFVQNQGCFTSHHFPRSGPKMAYFSLLYTDICVRMGIGQ